MFHYNLLLSDIFLRISLDSNITCEIPTKIADTNKTIIVDTNKTITSENNKTP